MKASIIIRIVCWSLLAAALTSFMVQVIAGGIGFNFLNIDFGWNVSRNDFKVVASKEAPLSGTRTLVIDWPYGNADVKPIEGNTVTVVQKSNDSFNGRDEVRVSQNGSELKIHIDSSFMRFSFFGWGSPPSDIEVGVPKSYDGAMVLRNTSGDFTAGDFNLSSLNAESTSGNVTLSNMTAADMSLRVTSGNLSATGMRGDLLNCRITSGYLAVSGQYREVITDQTSGRMELLGLNADSINAKSTSGRLDVQGEIKGITAKITSGSMSFDTTYALDVLNLRLTSGNITVAMPDSDGFELEIKRTSGSVDSDFPLAYSDIDRKGKGTYKNGGPDFLIDMTSGSVGLIMKPVTQ